MKKVLLAFIALIVSVSFSGCGSDSKGALKGDSCEITHTAKNDEAVNFPDLPHEAPVPTDNLEIK